jgi:hypothetical protein
MEETTTKQVENEEENQTKNYDSMAVDTRPEINKDFVDDVSRASLRIISQLWEKQEIRDEIHRFINESKKQGSPIPAVPLSKRTKESAVKTSANEAPHQTNNSSPKPQL